jgi:hypothetical protein
MDQKNDALMVKVCCDFISMNWSGCSVLQIKKVFRESLKQVNDLSTYRHDAIIKLIKNQYMSQEKKTVNDLKKIPKVIQELHKTIQAMTPDAQEAIKLEIQNTFKTKEQLDFIRELDDVFDLNPPPPSKKQRTAGDDRENILNSSMCSLFDL